MGGVLWAVLKLAVRGDLAVAKAEQSVVLGDINRQLAALDGKVTAGFATVQADVTIIKAEVTNHDRRLTSGGI
ncbi:hypothetical protein [Kineococcus sp. NPDC059986]|uniref:hypothetical protein n=1 Tax=Kineococcus sp. NPDC059986 TaxID=3155538 RepID=UPI00344FFB98